MDQGLDVALLEGALDLAEAGYDLPCLGGYRKRVDHAANQRAFGIGGKRRRHAELALEALAKLVTPDGFCNGLTRGGNPQAPAGKLALQIRDHLALGRHHKPDQLADGAHLPRDRAHPHRRGPAGPRPVVEIGVSEGKHARDMAP